MVCINVATTAIPMPNLLKTMESEAERRRNLGTSNESCEKNEGIESKRSATLARFAQALRKLSEDMQMLNTGRRKEEGLAFSAFDPSIMEVAVSL